MPIKVKCLSQTYPILSYEAYTINRSIYFNQFILETPWDHCFFPPWHGVQCLYKHRFPESVVYTPPPKVIYFLKNNNPCPVQNSPDCTISHLEKGGGCMPSDPPSITGAPNPILLPTALWFYAILKHFTNTLLHTNANCWSYVPYFQGYNTLIGRLLYKIMKLLKIIIYFNMPSSIFEREWLSAKLCI